jgi:hypothetical protein
VRRGAVLASGVVALVAGLVALSGAGALLLAVGSDDAIESAPVRLNSSGVALVIDDLSADTDLLALDGVGSLVVVVRGEGPVFVGESDPDQLDDYLAGAPYDAVVALDGAVSTRPVPGGQQPAPPTTVDIWVRSAAGDPARVQLPATPGTSVAIMRADARPGVSVRVSGLLRVPGAWTAGWVLLGVAVLLVVIGVVLLVRARRPAPAARHSATSHAGSDVLPGGAPVSAAAPLVAGSGSAAPAPAAGRPLPSEQPEQSGSAVGDGGDAGDGSDIELADTDPTDADVGLLSPPDPVDPRTPSTPEGADPVTEPVPDPVTDPTAGPDEVATPPTTTPTPTPPTTGEQPAAG